MDIRGHDAVRRWLGVAALIVFAGPACDDGLPSDLSSAQPASIRLNMHAVRLAVGDDTAVVATLHDRYGYVISTAPTGFQVNWSTSDPDVATVANGVVRSVGAGQAKVTATAASLPPASVDVQVVVPEAVIDGYHASVLGSLGGDQSNAWHINNGGVVTGWSGWSNAAGGQAFRWDEAHGMVGLPASSARGINKAGGIVGTNTHASGWSAYVLLTGDRIDLPALQEGSNSGAHRINDAGTIVGNSDPGSRAVVWRRGEDGSYGAPVVLGYRSSSESPVVNERGDIAFTAFDASFSGLYEPVVWQVQPDGSYGDALFLGRPEVGSYFVRDINDAGLIVGFRWTGAIEMAVLWHPDDYSAPIDLGVGQAWGINAKNQIVGVTGGELPTFGRLPRRPALWVVDARGGVAGPFDIGTPPGFDFAGARAINDDGWIIGSAWGPGQVMATLWRPER